MDDFSSTALPFLLMKIIRIKQSKLVRISETIKKRKTCFLFEVLIIGILFTTEHKKKITKVENSLWS